MASKRTPFFTMSYPLFTLIILAMLLAQAMPAVQHLDHSDLVMATQLSHTKILGSHDAKPTMVDRTNASPIQIDHIESLDQDDDTAGTDLAIGMDSALGLDTLAPFQNTATMAVKAIECVHIYWSDLYAWWCVVDFDKGLMIDRSLMNAGETCWWCSSHGWSQSDRIKELPKTNYSSIAWKNFLPAGIGAISILFFWSRFLSTVYLDLDYAGQENQQGAKTSGRRMV